VLVDETTGEEVVRCHLSSRRRRPGNRRSLGRSSPPILRSAGG
jgi:hypothetical protein